MFSLPGPFIAPAHPRALIVLLHGYGDTGDNFLAVAQGLAAYVPEAFFWVPDGLDPWEDSPLGRQWFSLQDVTLEQPFSPMLMQRMDQAAVRLLTLLKAGIGPFQGPILIGGFSQGAAMAMHIGLQHAPVAGIVGFSGFYTLTHPPRYCCPVFWYHGQDDQIVPITLLDQARLSFAHYHIPLQVCRIPKVAHTIVNPGLQAAGQFIQQLLYPL